MLTLTSLSLAASPVPTGEELLASWRKAAHVVLVTKARLAAFGPGYDPAVAAGRSDFVLELTTTRAPFCPPIPPFDLWTKVGVFPWAPYLNGCGGPTEFNEIVAEGDHVDLIGGITVPGAPAGDYSPVRVRVTPTSGGKYRISWRRETPADSPWSAPLTLVEGQESTLERLLRYQREAAPAFLAAAGINGGEALVDGAMITFEESKCGVWQWECAPDQRAVVCPVGEKSLVVVGTKSSVHAKVQTWNACGDGDLPGALTPR